MLPDKKAVTFEKLWSLLSAIVDVGPRFACFDLERAAHFTFSVKFTFTEVSEWC